MILSFKYIKRNLDHGQKKVRIGVVSDTHLNGYDEGMHRRITSHLSDVDMILHAGDMVHPDVLKMFGDKEIKAVRGNMDNDFVKEKFPDHLLFEINEFKILLIHGWGTPWGIEERITAGFDHLDCVVYGHTHSPVNHTKNNIHFFNPGSAVYRLLNSSKTIGILEIHNNITGQIMKL